MSNALCGECGSPFVPGVSQIAALCAECAHVLHDEPLCTHPMHETSSVKRDCVRCGWNGARSARVTELLAARASAAN